MSRRREKASTRGQARTRHGSVDGGHCRAREPRVSNIALAAIHPDDSSTGSGETRERNNRAAVSTRRKRSMLGRRRR